jgi:hypothetical protein
MVSVVANSEPAVPLSPAVMAGTAAMPGGSAEMNAVFCGETRKPPR